MLTTGEVWKRASEGWQVLTSGQCLDAADENYGAFLDAGGVPVPGHGGTALLVAGLLFEEAFPGNTGESRLTRLQAALRWLEEKGINENGRISSPDCNPDSGPDTAFVVQLWGGLLDAIGGLPQQAERGGSANVLAHVHRLLRRMLQGLVGAGFHTPNHRWVMASALAWGFRDTGEVALRRELDLFLAEGPDGDAEGFYPERSAGVYDAVSNRAFQLLHRWVDWTGGREDVRRNLNLIHRLLNTDGTVDTVFSTRHDAGAAVVPDCLLDVLLRAERSASDPVEREVWGGLLAAISGAKPGLAVSAALWLAWELVCGPQSSATAKAPPGDGEWFLRGGRCWRARRAGWSFRAMTGSAYPLVLRSPTGDEFRMAFAHAYMGTGAFVGDDFLPEARGLAWSLRHEARGVPFRPAYELPLGVRVAPEEYEVRRYERPLRSFPAAASVLSWKWTPTGAELEWHSDLSLAGVYAQWVIDFPGGMILETGTDASPVTPGELRFLASGAWAGWSGCGWRLRCGPGSSSHRMNPMRDALVQPSQSGRLLIALRTPFTHRMIWQFS